MPEIHATDEELILHYYGEPIENTLAEPHIAACGHCQRALRELADMLALVESQPVAVPLDGLEQRVWARLAPEVTRRRTGWLARFFAATPRWVLAGGVAAVVLAAFAAGRLTQTPVVVLAPQVASGPPAADPSRRVLLVALGDHLDQSQMVLLELLNGDTAGAADLEDEQDRARDLVAANRLYRQTAVSAGDARVGELLDALERVLLEIANAPSHASSRELEALRTHIEQRGILFRVRVVASEVREQQNVGAPAVTGP